MFIFKFEWLVSFLLCCLCYRCHIQETTVSSEITTYAYAFFWEFYNFSSYISAFCLLSGVFCLSRLHLWHLEVPRLGVESKLQLLAYATATAMRDLTHICDLYHGSQQHWMLTHWARPGIDPSSSWILVGFISTVPQWELLWLSFYLYDRPSIYYAFRWWILL